MMRKLNFLWDDRTGVLDYYSVLAAILVPLCIVIGNGIDHKFDKQISSYGADVTETPRVISSMDSKDFEYILVIEMTVTVLLIFESAIDNLSDVQNVLSIKGSLITMSILISLLLANEPDVATYSTEHLIFVEAVFISFAVLQAMYHTRITRKEQTKTQAKSCNVTLSMEIIRSMAVTGIYRLSKGNLHRSVSNGSSSANSINVVRPFNRPKPIRMLDGKSSRNSSLRSVHYRSGANISGKSFSPISRNAKVFSFDSNTVHDISVHNSSNGSHMSHMTNHSYSLSHSIASPIINKSSSPSSFRNDSNNNNGGSGGSYNNSKEMKISSEFHNIPAIVHVRRSRDLHELLNSQRISNDNASNNNTTANNSGGSARIIVAKDNTSSHIWKQNGSVKCKEIYRFLK
eukprot:gene8476-17469_t